MGPRRLGRPEDPRRTAAHAAMEEGRDGPSEAFRIAAAAVAELEPQWRRAEMGPRRSTRTFFTDHCVTSPQWRRAEMGPRRRPNRRNRCGDIRAAMEEGRDGPSEVVPHGSGWVASQMPQWRRAEMGPRRVEGHFGHLAGAFAAMEEGRDGPSEAIQSLN